MVLFFALRIELKNMLTSCVRLCRPRLLALRPAPSSPASTATPSAGSRVASAPSAPVPQASSGGSGSSSLPSTTTGEAAITWSNPRSQLHRVPNEVIYALPPPMKAPFPQTAAEKRSKVIKSWAPLVGFSLVFGAVYAYKTVNPTVGPVPTYTEVPDFLMRSMTKGKGLEAGAAAGPGAAANSPTGPTAGSGR
jgi:hypothetical protein